MRGKGEREGGREGVREGMREDEREDEVSGEEGGGRREGGGRTDGRTLTWQWWLPIRQGKEGGFDWSVDSGEDPVCQVHSVPVWLLRVL